MADETIIVNETFTFELVETELVVSDAGSPGPAGTITVGTVTTLNPGDPATVDNVGSPTQAVLDFGIPQGPVGPPGPSGGGTGEVGDPKLLEPARWFYVTSWYVDNGPGWTNNPPDYTTITGTSNGPISLDAGLVSALPVDNVQHLTLGKFNGIYDGVTWVNPQVGDRVAWLNLFYGGQDSGVYTITDVGSDTTPWVLTRASDTDEQIEGGVTYVVPLTGSTFYAEAAWVGAPVTEEFVPLPEFTPPNYDWAVKSVGGGALGSNAIGSGVASVALGRYAAAIGESSVAIGFGAQTNSSNSVSIGGDSSTAGYNAIALGNGAQANSNQSVAIGYLTVVEPGVENAVVIGPQIVLQDAMTVMSTYGEIMHFENMGRYWLSNVDATQDHYCILELDADVNIPIGQGFAVVQQPSGGPYVAGVQAPEGVTLYGPNRTVNTVGGNPNVTQVHGWGAASVLFVKKVAANTWHAWATPGANLSNMAADSAFALAYVGANKYPHKGDLVAGIATSNYPQTLPVGVDGQILTADSTQYTGLKWAAAPSTGISPTIVDAKGDLIGATANDTPARVPIGSDGQVLTADSAQTLGLKWATPAASISPTIVDAKGDLIAGTANDTVARLPVGADGSLLNADSTGLTGMAYVTRASLAADSAFSGTYVAGSTLTTKGDLLGRTSSAVARVEVGTNDYVLTADSAMTTGVKWAAIAQSQVTNLTTDLAAKAPATPTVGTSLGTSGTVDLDMSALNGTYQSIAISGTITFTTSNRAAGRTVTLKLVASGGARTLSFPSWLFVGAAAPTSLASGKAAIITVTFFDTTDAAAVAAYAAQP